MTRTVDTYEEFKVEIEKGGFILAHWDGTTETEASCGRFAVDDP